MNKPEFRICQLTAIFMALAFILSCTGGTQDPAPGPGEGNGEDSSSSGEEGDGFLDGKTTRYWDSCKHSCGWSANVGEQPLAKSCDVFGAKLAVPNTKSACDNADERHPGSAFACMDQAPWAVNDTLSYGFVATHAGGQNDCGKCFQFTFKNGAVAGKTMIVIASNIGADVREGQLDIMIPGGGVGRFDALTYQLEQNGVFDFDLGAQYGGFRNACDNPNSSEGPDKACVRDMCEQNFGSAAFAAMKAGCNWFIDWFGMSNNPSMLYKEVECPEELLERYMH